MTRTAFRTTGKHPPRSGFPSWLALIALGLALAVPGDGRVPGLPQEERTRFEYDVKAVFLYNFARYVRWPEALEPEGLTIVVFGESPIVPPLQEISGKKAAGRTPLVVRQCLELGRIGRPRILFIARSAVSKIDGILEEVGGTDVLMVGETEGLVARGVAINFVERDGTIKFEVSERRLKEAGIQVSSQLLKLAILVDEENGGGGR